MARNGVRRFVTTPMTGEGGNKANAPTHDRVLAALLRGVAKAAMEGAVEASGLDRAILRPAILSDNPAKGDVRAFDTATGEKANQITQADLASSMVAQLSNDQRRRQAVTVADG